MALKEVTHTTSTKSFSISLRWLMILGFGSLVGLSVGLVLFMSVATNFSNTISLLNDRAVTLIDGMERSIRTETDQAERAVRALAILYEEENLQIGALDQTSDNNRQAVLKSIIVATPVVEALLIYDLEGRRSGVFRTPEGSFGPIPFARGNDDELNSLLSVNPIETGAIEPLWGEPVVLNNTLYHNVGYPLERNGKIYGYAVAAIGQDTMNRIITGLGRDNETTAFILTADNKVLAHSRIPQAFDDRSEISLDEFPDAALQQLATARKLNDFAITNHQNMTVYESGNDLRRSGNVFITRELSGYSVKPYRLGAYFPKTEVGTEIQRAMASAFAGLAALALAVLASFFLSRRLSRPMHKIAKVANDFSNLRLDNFSPLPSSRIREIDEQSKAMNSMHTTLIEFSHYVPRTLVKRLMAPDSSAARSVEREITILFADIVGFTSMSEDLNATETASLLNSHFTMLCRQITKYHGTLDKFIGDGLMAFWGAPDADNDQAANALNAARDIVEIFEQNNAKRNKDGLPPLRLRIGIHTGRVVVGNIGGDGRHNYTLVGDAVNVAHRLEQFGRQHIGDANYIILASGITWEAAGKPQFLQPIGMQKLRGRAALIKVYAMGGTMESENQQPARHSG
ncbi:MAG: adenylate/guanylate cyclase domain-containing protein [Rhizobiaceae bacterium]|nr:adenylate/guanylate cyclase domain-containing protein [Rhizobiaceae bacterium]